MRGFQGIFRSASPKGCFWTLVLGLVFGSVGPHRAHAEAVLFVLDASRSMGIPIASDAGGSPRTLFDQAVANLRRDLSGIAQAGGSAGLIAFSHRTGTCGDIELLAPVETGSLRKIQTFLEEVRPKGGTPLAAALDVANQELKRSPPGTRVVLFSDGGDSCEGDAVAAARALKAEHPASRIDVQYFSTGGVPASRSVQEIAKVGGGGLSVLNYDGRSREGALPGSVPRSAGSKGGLSVSIPQTGFSSDVQGANYQVGPRAPQKVPDSSQLGPREGIDYPIYDPEEKLPALRFGERSPEKEKPAPQPGAKGAGIAASSAKAEKVPEVAPSARPRPAEVSREPLPPAALPML